SQMRIKWGKYFLPPSHGFGGLDSNIQLDVRDNVSISDLAAINKPDLHEVHLVFDLKSASGGYKGPVHFENSRNGKRVWTGTSDDVTIAAGETKTVEIDAN